MEIKETFEDDFLDTLWNLNGWDKKLKPELKTDKIQYRDVQAVTGALRDMAQAGAVLDPDDPAIAEIRALLGLSEPLRVADDLDASLLGDDKTKPDDNLDVAGLENG